MYTLHTTRQFERDVKRCAKRGLPMSELYTAISILVEKGGLPMNYHPHKLHGDRTGEWECHIQLDWLLVWEQSDTDLTLLMLNTGTHADIFK